MATLADLKRRLLHVLNDEEVANSSPIAGKQFDANILLESINAGLDAILPWMPKSAVASLTGDGTTVAYTLPADLYRLEAIWDSKKLELIAPMHLVPQSTWSDPQTENAYLEFPEGYVTLSKALLNGYNGKLYYSAMWTKPTLDTSAIEAPSITHTGIVLFAASYALLPKATASANIRQYASKVDSGTPVMNPMSDMSMLFLKRFEIEMSRHPSKQRGQK